jgi:glycosyltransferase involved in cell wall biosynthesis
MNRKLRVGFVCIEDVNDVKSWSGTPFHLMDALKKQDLSIEVFSPLKVDFRYALLPFKIGARVLKRDVEFYRFPLALRSFASQLKKRMQQTPVDVILSTGTVPITMLECPQPIVFYADAVFHMMPGYYGTMWDRLTSGSIRRGKWQEEAALERCSFGAYASNWAAEGARKLTAPAKIRVVPLGASIPVDHDLAAVQQWASERLKGTSTECRLLFIGVDWIRKGGDIAVEVARLLNQSGIRTKLTVVGCVPEGKVPEFVEVLGFIDKRSSEGRMQLEKLYKSATFFILPTRAEAAGVVFCEASAFGVPSLTFKTGGVEDYVRDGINGICLSIDSKPVNFAETIREILKDKDRYSELCLGAFNEYKSRLNWDSMAGALVNLCREAVRNHQR